MAEGVPFYSDEEEPTEPAAPADLEPVQDSPKARPEAIDGRPETYDKDFWTPERISASIRNFFEHLARDEQKLRAERERLLAEAIREAEAIRQAEAEIAEREMREEEEQRREQYQKDAEELEAQRLFRLTIEWMLEKGSEAAQDLALRFLNMHQATKKPSRRKAL